MLRSLIGATALAAALMIIAGGAQAFDDAKYPDLKGQWRRAGNSGLLSGGAGGLRWDDSKPAKNTPSLGQEPPLTPEYQAIYDANLADMEKGGQGIDPTYSCISPGMPRFMIAYSPMEIVVTPEVTYMLMERDHDHYPPHLYRRARLPRRHGGRIRSFSAIPSASGSMRTATAATTRSWSRPAA